MGFPYCPKCRMFLYRKGSDPVGVYGGAISDGEEECDCDEVFGDQIVYGVPAGQCRNKWLHTYSRCAYCKTDYVQR